MLNPALEMLQKKQHLLEYIRPFREESRTIADARNRFMTDTIMPVRQAADGYDIFDCCEVQNVIFEPYV